MKYTIKYEYDPELSKSFIAHAYSDDEYIDMGWGKTWKQARENLIEDLAKHEMRIANQEPPPPDEEIDL